MAYMKASLINQVTGKGNLKLQLLHFEIRCWETPFGWRAFKFRNKRFVWKVYPSTLFASELEELRMLSNFGESHGRLTYMRFLEKQLIGTTDTNLQQLLQQVRDWLDQEDPDSK